MQCLTTASPISQVKYINKNGQYTGIRNISNHVHSHDTKPSRHSVFQRLNSLRERRTGLSPSVRVKIATLYSRNRAL